MKNFIRTTTRFSLRLFLIVVFLAGLLVVVQPGVVQAAGSISVSCNQDLSSIIAAAPNNSTILFRGDCTFPISSTLNISKTLTLNGNGHAVALDGGGSTRIFFVTETGNLTLKGLTVRNGFVPLGEGPGGGLSNGGGTVTITNSTFSGNSGGCCGGGLANSQGTMTISNSTFSGNSAQVGGSIYNVDGTMTISNSTISGNTAVSEAGGLFSGCYSTLTIKSSIFSGNTAGTYGGGLGICGDTSTISNSTISGNTAKYGGGISNAYALLTISNSTFSGNTAVYGLGSDLYNYLSGTAILKKTVLSCYGC